MTARSAQHLSQKQEASAASPSKIALEFDDHRHLAAIAGPEHQFLARIEQKLGVRIADRGNTLLIEGDAPSVQKAETVLLALYDRVQGSGLHAQALSLDEVDTQLRYAAQGQVQSSEDGATVRRGAAQTPRVFRPKSPGQAAYRAAMAQHDLVFALGPAGTGKTFLAVLQAVEAFQAGQVERIILARPAIEAGERIGFLPGDLQEKLDPYMRPLYDALDETLGPRQRSLLMDKERGARIEIIPLAFMRGRTFKQSFVILDEAQNTTIAQMKMVLTRLGAGSRIVVAGDPSQVDLPQAVPSGLLDAVNRLAALDGVASVRLDGRDVMRHELVARIVAAYERDRR